MAFLRCTLFLLPLFWLTSVSVGDNSKPGKEKSDKEALQAFNNLIGSWDGTAIQKKPKSAFWMEEQHWSWRFKGDKAWLVVKFVEGKYFRSGELHYNPKKKNFDLTVTTADKKEKTFTGEFKDNKLTVTHKDETAKESQRLIIHILRSNRIVYYYQTLPDGRTFWDPIYKVGMNREGVDFVKGSGQPECIVSGGLGSMSISYKGNTYYVCCSGCRDEFLANPERYIAEAKKKKK